MWSKSIFVLWRFPGLLAALLVGTTLLAGVVAAYPLFLSASAGVLVDKHLRDVNRYTAGWLIQDTTGFLAARRGRTGDPPRFDARTDVFAGAVAAAPSLGDPIVTMLSDPLEIGSAEGGRRRQVRLIARTDALANIETNGPTETSGAWVADLIARYIKVAPGEPIEVFEIGARRGTEVDVAGTYRALYNEPRTPYWSGLEQYIYPPSVDDAAPPPFVFVDLDEFIRITGSLRQETGLLRWEAPVTAGTLSLEDARELASSGDRFAHVLTDPSTEAGRAFRCTDCFFANERPRFSAGIGQVVHEVDRRMAAVGGPAQVVLIAGLVVALSVLAGAGAFVVATRARESGFLFARGMGSLAFGIKTSLESAFPALAGGICGYLSVRGLVGWIGPQGPVGKDAVETAVLLATLSAPAAILLLSLVAAAAFAGHGERRRRLPSWAGRVPWELAALAVGVVVFVRLERGGALVAEGTEGVDRPSLELLLFPFLAIGSTSILAGRAARALLRGLRANATARSHAVHLAINRLAGAGRLASLLFVATAVALGTFVHAQAIVRSLTKTVDAKSLLFVGSDVQTTMNYTDVVPEDFPFPSTKVSTLPRAGTFEGRGQSVDVLAVDPETFATAAYWDETFADRSLDDILADVRDRGQGPLRAIVVNYDIEGAARFSLRDRTLPLDVVETTASFPGVSSLRPLLVFDIRAVERAFDTGNPLSSSPATTQFWIKGDPGSIEEATATLDPPPYYSIRVDDVKDVPSIAAVIDTFSVLQILGIAAGLLAVVAVLMYLQARQRARVVSHGLARRMGLSALSHRRALFLELIGLLVASYVVGIAAGIGSAAVIVRLIDPLATIPPPPLFRPPFVVVGVALLVLSIVSLAAARLTDERTARTNLAEVMRVAD